jgi:hypothetical protein
VSLLRDIATAMVAKLYTQAMLSHNDKRNIIKVAH